MRNLWAVLLVSAVGLLGQGTQRVETYYFLVSLSSANEVPALADLSASGYGVVQIKVARDASGKITSGTADFDLRYTFPAEIAITGMHIHTGAAGVNGPVSINSGVSGSAPVSDVTGRLGIKRQGRVAPTDTPGLSTLEGLLADPSGYYVNLHTTTHPNGAIRGQLLKTTARYLLGQMSPANEVPPVDLKASAAGAILALRGSDATGAFAMGLVQFDVAYSFPETVTITGMHVHTGAAGVNGPVTLNSGVTAVESAAGGTGRIQGQAVVLPGAAPASLEALDGLFSNPAGYYVNLHTRTNPGGAVRAQLRQAGANPPKVGYIMSAITDPQRTTVAPGGLMTVWGSDLAEAPGGLAGYAGEQLPYKLNGTEVTIGGLTVPVLVVTPDYVVAQVPVEAPAGTHPVVVRTPSGASAPFSATVAAAAPAIFFDSVGGIVVNNSNFRLIRPDFPARAGDVLLTYSTGLGQTTPPLVTGMLAGYPPAANTLAVTVTLGGMTAEVLYSMAAPGYAGLYQTAIRVPAGLAPGNAALQMRLGEAASNTVNLAVQ